MQPLPNEPIWLPIEAVINANVAEVSETGERHFVRDLGLLESALARPRNAFVYGEQDAAVLAVALMAGIARAHAFEQGNKRTAFAALRLFLQINGYDTIFADTLRWVDEINLLIEHRSTEEAFVGALRSYVVSAGDG